MRICGIRQLNEIKPTPHYIIQNKGVQQLKQPLLSETIIHLVNENVSWEKCHKLVSTLLKLGARTDLQDNSNRLPRDYIPPTSKNPSDVHLLSLKANLLPEGAAARAGAASKNEEKEFVLEI